VPIGASKRWRSVKIPDFDRGRWLLLEETQYGAVGLNIRWSWVPPAQTISTLGLDLGADEVTRTYLKIAEGCRSAISVE